MKSEIEEATAGGSKVWSAFGNLQPSAPQYEEGSMKTYFLLLSYPYFVGYFVFALS